MQLTQSRIEEEYRARTPTSRRLMDRAKEIMPGGSTRTMGHYKPYPAVMQRGEGALLWDVDGNRYIDLIYNGLAIIHGHGYPPVTEALKKALGRGSAWPGASVEQIEFAEMLCARLEHVDRVRFTNSGTEAAMLAVKVARKATGRPLILKAWDGYHGSYSDLEAGLQGQGGIPGRVLLGRFGDAGSFEQLLSEHGSEVAAVIIEPIAFTGIVTPPPPGFLRGLQEAAHRAGALFIVDDCLMFRLAPGGSAEKYDLQPDLTVLGKFIGGGLPMGVVGGREDVMSVLDYRREGHIYHGGSFNGNLLSCVAGAVSLNDLTRERIVKMDRHAERLRSALHEIAASHQVPLTTSGEGSAFGIYLTPELPQTAVDANALTTQLHLACLNHGVNPGHEAGQMCAVMATELTDELLGEVIEGFRSAFGDLASWQEGNSDVAKNS